MTAVPLHESTNAPAARPNAWWGMLLVIATEATLFALVLASYFYLRFKSMPTWPPDGIADPKLLLPALATLILVASSLPVALASARTRSSHPPRPAVLFIAIAFSLGVAFLVLQAYLLDASADKFRPQTNAYGSIFYTVLGLHAAHVVIGLLLAVWAASRIWSPPVLSPARVLTVQVTALYWHFVNVVAVAIYLVLYLSPRL